MKNNKLPAATPLAAALALAFNSPAHAFDASATDLDTVHVQGQKTEAVTSPKFTQPLLDTPQSVTIVPAELMHEQGVTTLRDALRNVPGISMQAGEGGVPAGDNLTLRGFSARTDLFVDGIRDFGGYSRDPFNIEQIEVIKGPASTHTGRGSTGGSINLASKAASNESFNRVGVSVGDDDLARATADFNHVLGDTSAFRVNLMAHNSGVNGRDHVDNERWGVAPTLAFGLGTDTSVNVSLFHLEQDNVPDYGQPWVPHTNNALPTYHDQTAPVDRSNWYGILERDYEKTRTDMATVAIKHAFSGSLTLENTTRWGAATRDSVITAPRFAGNDSTAISRAPKMRDSRDSIIANVTNLSVGFKTGGIEHALVAGVELSHEESKNRGRKEASTTPNTDLFNPDPHGAFSPIVADPLGNVLAEADSAAAYVFDTLTLSPKWELSGGLRWDRFDSEAFLYDKTNGINDWRTYSRTDSVLSGRVGAVFKPVENGSIYVGYGTSFNPSAEGLSLNDGLVKVKPEESRTIELGTKWNLFDSRLMLTSAIFRTEKTNARIDLDTSSTGVVYALDGEQRVDGFEIGAAGRISKDWTVNFGYAFLDSEILSNRAISTEVGNELPNTPRHSASLWTTYQVTDALELGLGVQHVGSRWTATNNERLAKSYTAYDAMVGYRINDTVALRLNGYNLSNKEYVDRVGGGHYTPGAERTLMLSADFSF